MIILIDNFDFNSIPEYKKVVVQNGTVYLHFDNLNKIWLVITEKFKTYNFVELAAALNFINELKGGL